jgi:hypothetical protein
LEIGIISHDVGDVHFGLEFSGIVTDTRRSVTNVVPSKRVLSVASSGMFAPLIRIASTLVVPIPSNLNFEDTTTIGNYTTIILTLITIGQVQPEQVQYLCQSNLPKTKLTGYRVSLFIPRIEALDRPLSKSTNPLEYKQKHCSLP